MTYSKRQRIGAPILAFSLIFSVAGSMRAKTRLSPRNPAESTGKIESNIAPGMSGTYRYHFRMGFSRALERLRQLPGCRGLFEDLRLSASEVLGNSLFALT